MTTQHVWTWAEAAINSNVTILYCPVQIDVSALQTADPSHTYLWKPWPTNVPTQLQINRARLGHQSACKTTPYGQVTLSVDPGRVSYNSGGQFGNNGSIITLVSLFTGADVNEPQERTEVWHTPVTFDANQDLLWFTQDGGLDQWWFQIGYLC